MSMYGKNHYNISVISLQLIKINGKKKKKTKCQKKRDDVYTPMGHQKLTQEDCRAKMCQPDLLLNF